MKKGRMPKYAAKPDTNQGKLFEQIRGLWGPNCIINTSKVGGGFPDFILGLRGVNLFFEVKTETGELNELQVIFHKNWESQGQIAIARTMEDVIAEVSRHTT